jgi:hypothetical protein
VCTSSAAGAGDVDVNLFADQLNGSEQLGFLEQSLAGLGEDQLGLGLLLAGGSSLSYQALQSGAYNGAKYALAISVLRLGV